MLFKVLRVLLVLSLVGFASAIVVQAVLAHGAMQNPMSRVYSCYLENPETPDTMPCRDAIAMGGTQPLYDWNEVNLRNAGGNHRTLIPDGKLCSAGRDKYAAFDQPRLDWPVTILPSSGNFTFNFTAAVPHNMGHFELYVTRNGYDPLQPLKWSDLEDTPFLYVEEPPVINGAYVFSGALPEGKSGRHLIYTIWQRHDSAEAFYSCSDVWFGTSPTPQPTTPPLCTAPDWSSSIVYQMNDLVNHNGKQWRAKWSNASTEPSSEGGVSPWEIQGYCQRSGGATSTPTSIVPTATRTNTPIVPTATRTNTPIVSTATRTNTPVGPTATRTNTPVVPTATRTNTPIVPTATRTNTPTSGATCTVTYSNLNDWGFGFTTNVVIRNNGASAINGWTLTWSFTGNQAVNNLWNGSYTQTGQSVSVTNLSYNNLIPANGGTVNFGFNAAYSGTNTNPTSFSLNGVACQ